MSPYRRRSRKWASDVTPFFAQFASRMPAVSRYGGPWFTTGALSAGIASPPEADKAEK